VTEEPDWRQYERQIFERLNSMAGDAEVEFDVELPGRLSGVGRRLDAVVRGQVGPIGRVVLGVDCKCFSKRVDVKGVETVIGLFEDVGVDIGLLVTTEGFTPAAARRAATARGMRVEIVPYEGLADWEPDFAWCHVCTDLASEDFPGGVFLVHFDSDRSSGDAGGLKSAGLCERCQAIHVRCECGAVGAATEEEEREWRDCEGGCGTQWRVRVAYDHDRLPLTSDPRAQVEVRAA